MLKTTKRYVFNSDRVNNYGFRILSTGIDQSQYKNNPVMLWMHYRPTGASKNEILAPGYIDDIKIDKNGVMDGQPYFDDTDPFAKSLYDKYENGTYNMFSLCALPLETSMEPADLLPGQTGPTITKSLLKEISAVDIGGNPDACGVELCDENGNLIKLSDIGSVDALKNLKPGTAQSELAKLSALTFDQLFNSDGLMRLKDLSFETYREKFVEKYGKEPNQAKPSNTVLKQVEKPKAEAANEKWANDWVEIDEVLKFGLEVGKITDHLRGFYLEAALKDGKMELVKKMVLAAPINPDLLVGRYDPYIIKLACMKWEEIDRECGTPWLKDRAPEIYLAKFYEKNGRMPGVLKN